MPARTAKKKPAKKVTKKASKKTTKKKASKKSSNSSDAADVKAMLDGKKKIGTKKAAKKEKPTVKLTKKSEVALLERLTRGLTAEKAIKSLFSSDKDELQVVCKDRFAAQYATNNVRPENTTYVTEGGSKVLHVVSASASEITEAKEEALQALGLDITDHLQTTTVTIDYQELKKNKKANKAFATFLASLGESRDDIVNNKRGLVMVDDDGDTHDFWDHLAPIADKMDDDDRKTNILHLMNILGAKCSFKSHASPDAQDACIAGFIDDEDALKDALADKLVEKKKGSK